MKNSKKIVKLNNQILAKAFAIRLEELIDELACKSVLNNDSILEKDANYYTDNDWDQFPSLSKSVNFKSFGEIRICIDRLRHRQGINPSFYLNVSPMSITQENLERIVFVFETEIDIMKDPLKHPKQSLLLKNAIEIGTSSKKFEKWLSKVLHSQSQSFQMVEM